MRRFGFFWLLAAGALVACSLHSLDSLDRCTGKPDSADCPLDGAKGGDGGALAGTGATAGASATSGAGGLVSGGGNSGGGGVPITQAGMGGDASGVAGAGGAADTGLVLLYADHSHVDHDPATAARAVRPNFLIENHGDTAVPLSELTIRYFYTLEAAATQTFLCDYVRPDAVVDKCVGVMGEFGSLTGKQAKNYVEVSFVPPAGETWELAALGGQSGPLQLRFYNGTFQSQDQTNDYSYNAAIVDDPAEWDHVALYRNGALVYGVEPN